MEDLNRQIIKSDSATLSVPCIALEIPPHTQRGSISTIEGFLKKAANNLEFGQSERLTLGDVDNFYRCRAVILKLRQLIGEEDDEDDSGNENALTTKGKPYTFTPFAVTLDDPAGNSYIENPFSPSNDPNMKTERYYRTPTQDMALGLQPSQEALDAGVIDDLNPTHKNVVNVSRDTHLVEINLEEVKHDESNNEKGITNNGDNDENISSNDDDNNNTTNLGKQEALTFPTACPHCRKPTETKMCVTNIPHFKEVIIMSLLCEHCGYRSNEIKGGGAIPKYGTKTTLHVDSMQDLGREVLKSDTAGLEITELELEMEEGGLDGVYTTVEGLLSKVYDRLKMVNAFSCGDAAKKQHINNDGGDFSERSIHHVRYDNFLNKLKEMADGKAFPFTMIIIDPLSNSFVGPIPKDCVALARQSEKEGGSLDCYDAYVDAGITIEEFERTNDQNEILGLNDIKTEHYQSDSQKDERHDGVSHVIEKEGTTKERKYFGTDQMEDRISDQLRQMGCRGPDHPFHPIDEEDTTDLGRL
uniref:Zinc finger ZPR1-type domain-containing protein n=1 Tax=Ditylum brightwellii TaxID=49249 RepID=A0A7S4QUC3_9STRA